MLEKTIAAIDEVFDEVAAQYLYLKSRNSITDVRLANYVCFVNDLVNSFYPRKDFTKQTIQELIESLHLSLWEEFLFKNRGNCQNGDGKWMLLHLEKRLLNSSAIYQNFWTDLDTQERAAEDLKATLARMQPSIQKGSIWEIKDEAYVVGASFAFKTDLWLRSINEMNSAVQYSRRLSDFLPLIPDDFKLILVAIDVKV